MARVGPQRHRVGKKITYTVNCNHTITATVYVLETWFASGISYVNTLHMGDQ